jgi:hypothetical protein
MLAAAAAADPTSIAAYLLAQGPVGVLALVIGWFGWQVLKRERDRADAERTRADAERARTDTLVNDLLSKAIPALEESARTQKELVEWFRDERRGNGSGRR